MTALIPPDLLAKRRITPSGCWEWTGATCPAGYGTTRWDGRKQRVHRIVAHLAHGLDLDNSLEYARHKCDNPPCFNPDHLTPGTPRDNQQDAIRRARRIRSHCKRGHVLGGDNIVWDKEKGRKCRECDRKRKREYEERQKAKGPRVRPVGPRVECPTCGLSTSRSYLPRHIRHMHAAGHVAQLDKTHCTHGHLYTELNTFVDANGHRVCRACRRDANTAYRLRLKEGA